VKVPRQASWLSGHGRILSLPIPLEVEQWLARTPKRRRLADHSGGTAADLHGLSFYPDGGRGTAGTGVVKEQLSAKNLARVSATVNLLKLLNARFEPKVVGYGASQSRA
jgi:hypothetical protein